ncbi:restriction endonuclease subunit S [Kitasatospora sp. NPDC050467]|uniref:restriction endonuclease subunit S n=1 Tax=Kitasatospora sp. NPDC050467 TaxID=3364053 RepID=UPI0037971F5F
MLVRLADVLSEPLINGRSVRTMDNGFPVLRLTALKTGGVDLAEHKNGAWTEHEANPFLVTEGDFLLSRGNGSLKLVGRGAMVRRVEFPVAFPDTMIRVRTRSDVIRSDYLALAWESDLVRTQIEKSARTTAGIYKINQKILEGVALPLPPLAEQQRIIEALESHLSSLDAANGSLDRSLDRANSLQRRLANDAIDTSLTDTEETTLGAVAATVRNGIFVSRASIEPNGVPILRIGAVRPLKLDASDVRYTGVEADSDDLRSSLLEPGDLLFTRYNGNPNYVGACAVVPQSAGVLTYPDKLIRVVVDREKVIPDYIALSCSAGQARQYIRECVKTTAGQAGISGRDLKSVPLRIPSLEEQQIRIDRFRSSAFSVEQLQKSISRAQARASHLRKAILARAFTGALIPQDPDDESAAVLLDQLRSGREASAKGKSARARSPRKAPAMTDSTPAPVPVDTQTSTFLDTVQQEFEL